MLHRELGADLPDYPAGRQDNYRFGKVMGAPSALSAPWDHFRQANPACSMPGERARTKPDQCLPQWFVDAIADDRFRCRLGIFVERADATPGGERRGDRTLLQQEARDAMPAEVGIGALDDNGSEMLQFQRESRFDADNECRRGGAIFRSTVLLPRRPLHFDRLRHRGEPLADNLVPKQPEIRLAKTLPSQNRIDRRLNEVGERPGPRVFSETVPHVPLYLVSAGAPHENLAAFHFEKVAKSDLLA
jgi:hypothetical protein